MARIRHGSRAKWALVGALVGATFGVLCDFAVSSLGDGPAIVLLLPGMLLAPLTGTCAIGPCADSGAAFALTPIGDAIIGVLIAAVVWNRCPKRAYPGPFCAQCGYCLRGNVSGTCPECGHAIQRTD
jgi:CBS-domain-containing membrane protein